LRVQPFGPSLQLACPLHGGWDGWRSVRRGARVGSMPGWLAEEIPMYLFIWLPAMFVLGLGTLGLMFAFVSACDKV